MILPKLPKSKRFQSSLSLATLFKAGLKPSLKHCNAFLVQLYRASKFRFIPPFISQLHSNQIEGDHTTYSLFTRALLKQHNYETALEFTQIGKPLQNQILDALIQGLCLNAKDPERGFSILKDFLKINGILPSSFTFCALIRCFSQQGKMDRAIEVLEVMADEKFKYPFDNFVFSSVISGFVNIGKPELALGFYENAAKSATLEMNVVTYTCLLSAYCRLERFEEVSDLVCRAEEDGLAFDVVFYGSLVYEYFRVGVITEAFRKHKEMVERKIEPDTISYTLLIDGFSKEGLVEKAVGFLHRMRRERIKPNLITYTAIMLGFCKKGKLEEALTVLKTVEDLGMEVDEFAYATLIDGFCKMRDFDGVFRVLDEMEEKGFHPSVLTYNIIINGLCKDGRTMEAYEVSLGIGGDVVTYTTLLHGYIEENNSVGLLMTKNRLEEAGVRMDVTMCNVLIKSLFSLGSFEDAYVLYKGMPEMGLIANHVTFCTLIDGYCKFGRIEEALAIFDEFRRTSIGSVACYNSIMNGLCKKGMTDMAIRVFLELNGRGMSLNPYIYRNLLKSIIRATGPDGILDFLSRIEKSGTNHLHTICGEALCFLCDGGFSESASALYSFMSRNALVLTRKCYYSLMNLLLNDRKMCLSFSLSNFVKEIGVFEPRMSKIILHYLCTKDVRLASNFLKTTQTLTLPFSVLEKLIHNGRAEDAFKLLMEAKERIPFMTVVDYTILVDALCKTGHIRKSLDVCTLAKKHGVTLNIITYNSVINGLCRQGCIVEAFRLFDSLEKIGMTPSEITYATLIDTLCKQGHLLDAKKLLKRMVLQGLKPNIRVHNSLIVGYSKLGKLPEVLSLVADLDEKGVKGDEFTVSNVISCFCRNGNMEGALEYYFDSRMNGLLPDMLGFFYLIRGLCSKGRMEESRSVLRDMLQIETIIDLLKKVETETESVDGFLVSLCDQGNIREAIMILDQIVQMFFRVGKKVDDGELPVAGSEPLISDHEQVVFDDFDTYYRLLASLCSRGELKTANKVAKLLAGFDGG